MGDATALNMEYFNENINGGKEFNLIYKKSYEKQDHIVTGECILNYLLEHNFSKPFIKQDYMMKSNNNLYFEKLNIKNYKSKLNDGIMKNSKGPISIGNLIMKRILGILDTKNNKKHNASSLKINTLKINENKPLYLNTEGNKEIKDSFYQKYLLPKINKENNKNNYNLNNSIFKNTSINKTIEDDEKIIRKKISKDKINYFSPNLKKSILPIFKNINERHSLSVKKAKVLNHELQKIQEYKFDINDYNNNNISNKKKNENNIKITDKKYHLINLFKNLGKVKDPKEIEKTLFTKDNKNYKLLKLKLQKSKDLE